MLLGMARPYHKGVHRAFIYKEILKAHHLEIEEGKGKKKNRNKEG